MCKLFCFVFSLLFAVCSLVENVQKFKRLNKLLIKIKMTILLFFLVVVRYIYMYICCLQLVFPFKFTRIIFTFYKYDRIYLLLQVC